MPICTIDYEIEIPLRSSLDLGQIDEHYWERHSEIDEWLMRYEREVEERGLPSSESERYYNLNKLHRALFTDPLSVEKISALLPAELRTLNIKAEVVEEPAPVSILASMRLEIAVKDKEDCRSTAEEALNKIVRRLPKTKIRSVHAYMTIETPLEV